LYDYWESTYIGAPRRGRRQAPLYRIENWNQLSREQEGLPRTNNSLEGWHHGFQSMLGAHHPQIFTFIDYIRKEQGITDVQKSRLAADIQRRVSSKSTYVRSGRRIQSIIQQYRTMTRLRFVNAIQHNLTITL
jgi:hypothetical protein